MAAIQSEIVIAAPVERIFDFIVKDPTRLMDIWPNLDEVWNVLPLPDGRKGKTFNLAYKMAGRRVEDEKETILCLTNQRNVNRTRGVESTTSWDFEEVEGVRASFFALTTLWPCLSLAVCSPGSWHRNFGAARKRSCAISKPAWKAQIIGNNSEKLFFGLLL